MYHSLCFTCTWQKISSSWHERKSVFRSQWLSSSEPLEASAVANPGLQQYQHSQPPSRAPGHGFVLRLPTWGDKLFCRCLGKR